MSTGLVRKQKLLPNFVHFLKNNKKKNVCTMAGNPFAASTSSSSSAPRENVYYLGEEEEEEEPTYWQRLVRPNKNILFF